MVECLLSMDEVLGQFATLQKPGLVVNTCNPSAREAEAAGSEVQGRLHSKLEASLLCEALSQNKTTK